MSKRKIKIRYIVILPVLICALIFIRKLMKLNDLDAKEVAEIILVSPPYKKRITDQQEIEEFTRMFNNKKKRDYRTGLYCVTKCCKARNYRLF